jgi:hypothetical protein
MSEKTKRKESDNLENWYQQRRSAWSVRRAMFILYGLFVPVPSSELLGDKWLIISGMLLATAVVVFSMGYTTARMTHSDYKYRFFSSEFIIRGIPWFNKFLYGVASIVFMIPLFMFLQLLWDYAVRTDRAYFSYTPLGFAGLLAVIISYAVSFYLNFLGQTRAEYDYYRKEQNLKNSNYERLTEVGEPDNGNLHEWVEESELSRNKLR